MKAFTSYSLNDKEQFIITLLSYKLKENGFEIVTSANPYLNVIDFTTHQKILNSQLFIGIVTSNGSQWKKVFMEWNFALTSKIPTILLVEENVKLNKEIEPKCVRFNRFKPELAIQAIEAKMKINNRNSNTNEALGWLLGGAALIALISLLSSDNKK